ncbi:NlpC/P60 family protein [Paratractidigestivibacter sp.]|uniref:NlpC/P60 family protein n=1 Tax=Paratractidigestivibacter sp. TaxID=2847316 RepID=UPI002ABDFA78|nr:NlpC/P60 family protein [Paratractidigestivibacter sp.]
MYRLYNRYNGERLHTADADEKASLVNIGWSDESNGWYGIDAAGNPTEGASADTKRAAAVAATKSLVGKSYEEYTCSDVCRYTCQQAGVGIPGYSCSQYETMRDSGTWVTAMSRLRPGDLLFYGLKGSGTRVSLYIGNGQVVQSIKASATDDGQGGVTIRGADWCRNFLGGGSPRLICAANEHQGPRYRPRHS